MSAHISSFRDLCHTKHLIMGWEDTHHMLHQTLQNGVLEEVNDVKVFCMHWESFFFLKVVTWKFAFDRNDCCVQLTTFTYLVSWFLDSQARLWVANCVHCQQATKSNCCMQSQWCRSQLDVNAFMTWALLSKLVHLFTFFITSFNY